MEQMLRELYVLGALTLSRRTQPPTPPPTPSLFHKVGGGGLQDKCVGNLQVCLNTHYSSLGRDLRGSAAARLSHAIRREARRGHWVSGGRGRAGCWELYGWGRRVKRKKQQTSCKIVSTEFRSAARVKMLFVTTLQYVRHRHVSTE